MKILIVFRRKDGESWEVVKNLKTDLEKLGHLVDLFSREDDLGAHSLSGSMDSLKKAVKRKYDEKNYDIIYTQDWSIAFPLLIPEKVLFEKHYCFFHDIEENVQSKIFQKIVGNMLKEKLIVRKEELRKKFPKSTFSVNGLDLGVFKK